MTVQDQTSQPLPREATTLDRVLLWTVFLGTLATFALNSDSISVIRELASTSAWAQLRLVVVILLLLAVPVTLVLKGSQGSRRLLWLLPVISLLILLDVTYGGRDPDEAVHLRMAWLMTQGVLPYVDFFTVRNLLWHLCMTPVTLLLEDDMRILAVVRTIELLVTLATFAWLVPVCRAARCHPLTPFLVFAFPFYAWGAVEFRADPPMTLLLVGSLWALSKERPILAGVFSGLAYLMLQKAAFHGIAIGAGILLSGMGVRTLLRYAVPATLISLLPFPIAYATRIGDFYYECAYQCSGVFASYHQKTPFLKSMPVLVFGIEVQAIPVIFLAAAIGLGIWWRGGQKYERMLAVALVVDFIVVFGTKLAFKNYLLFPLLLLSLAVSAAFKAALDRRWKSDLENALPVMIVLSLLAVASLRWSAVPPPTGIPIEDSQFILNILPKNETFYGNGGRANLVSPIFRKNPNYYAHDQFGFQAWLGNSGFKTPYYPPADLHSVAKNPPGVAVFAKERISGFLDVMKKEAGVSYLEVGDGIYLREDLREQAEPYLTGRYFPISRTTPPTQPEE